MAPVDEWESPKIHFDVKDCPVIRFSSDTQDRKIFFDLPRKWISNRRVYEYTP